MAIIDDFKARFPEFETSIVDIYIPILEPIIPAYFNHSYVGVMNKEATLQLLAHLITIETQATKGGTTGARGSTNRVQSSVSVGSVSQSFEKSANDSDWAEFFNTTRYGQSFLNILSTIAGGFVV